MYQDGLGPYEYTNYQRDNPSNAALRTGDFYHTTVDPLDDLTLWTTESFAGTFLGNINSAPATPMFGVYGWKSSFATLSPPGVLFVGSNNLTEGEPPPLATCSDVTDLNTSQVSPPPNSKNGDVFIVNFVAGLDGINAPILLPGWTLLNMSNIGSTSLISTENGSGCVNAFETSYIAIHQYSTNDSTPYVFSVYSNPLACAPSCLLGESGGFLTSYRFADTNFANYVAYGYDNAIDPNFSSTQAINGAPSSRQLLTVFSGAGSDPDENSICDSFSQPSGSPGLSVESLLVPSCQQAGFLAADIWTGNGGSFGGYSVSTSASPPGSFFQVNEPAWQVLVPPKP